MCQLLHLKFTFGKGYSFAVCSVIANNGKSSVSGVSNSFQLIFRHSLEKEAQKTLPVGVGCCYHLEMSSFLSASDVGLSLGLGSSESKRKNSRRRGGVIA